MMNEVLQTCQELLKSKEFNTTIDSINNIFNSYSEYPPIQNKLFMAKISVNNGKGVSIIFGEELFDKGELSKISDWWFNKDHKYYKDNFYKLDLEHNYLFFKAYSYPDCVILLGEAIEQNFQNKLLFIEMRQEHLKRLIHG